MFSAGLAADFRRELRTFFALRALVPGYLDTRSVDTNTLSTVFWHIGQAQVAVVKALLCVVGFSCGM